MYISESGLYSLIMSSKLPHAKAFKRWVLKEVLPTIRRTGGYTATQPAAEEANEPTALTDAQQWDARRALLDALSASHSLAQVAGIQLGDGHRKAIENAINEVLLPLGQQQSHMIDAAEFLKRKGHSPPEVARLASEFGRALKRARASLGGQGEEKPRRTTMSSGAEATTSGCTTLTLTQSSSTPSTTTSSDASSINASAWGMEMPRPI